MSTPQLQRAPAFSETAPKEGILQQEDGEHGAEDWLPGRGLLAMFCMITFAVYLSTVAPGIAGGDSGELVAESCHLGTIHPPGYPLLTLLNYAVIQILPGLLMAAGLRPGAGTDGRASPAWCANALAALFGALSAVCIAHAIALLCKRLNPTLGRTSSWPSHIIMSLASVSGGALLAFSPLVWQYSVTAEVFALNNFLVALIICLTLCFARNRTRNRAAFGALTCGLALSNQHTAVLCILPLALWVAWQLSVCRCRHHPKPWRTLTVDLSCLTISFFMGITPYAYLPLAAHISPQSGSWGDVTNWSGLLHHIRRGDYGSFRLYSGSLAEGQHLLLRRLTLWGVNLSARQGVQGLVPAIATLGMICLLLHISFNRCDKEVRSFPKGEADNSFSCKSSLGSGARIDNCSEVVTVDSGTNGVKGAKVSIVENNSGEQDEHKTEGKKKTWASTIGGWDDEGSSVSAVLLVALVFYLVVFHWLSNMPLADPLLFGIHARFWMQPNIFVFVFFGTGLYSLFIFVG
ncbi:unnamed protein product [Choristocarpus tenellus]